uniref:Uncharacterized protein n=1 Tax=Vannella robusta TaxID=1487602 RepID=A0A7S4HSE0_9EUKA|mmetsp:Transcript_15129/g.19137  ORF Transcript_15129/g.19137 Transcript_15129/m.19137 type:complete len:188 (+) Transcript_15129:180-743(+)
MWAEGGLRYRFGIQVKKFQGFLLKFLRWVLSVLIMTAGQERFRSVTRSYYRGSAGAILVYDISNRESFNHVSSWLADARSLASTDVVIVLVGNKVDKESERDVQFLEASRFAQENDLMFLETSALTGDGIQETYLKCARSILTKIEQDIIDPDCPGSGVQHGDSNAAKELSEKKRRKQQNTEEGGCC